MTANKDFKRIIRKRMSRTGESYAAARRHFRHSEGSSTMTTQVKPSTTIANQGIGTLALKLKTTRTLRSQGIERIDQLVKRMTTDNAPSGLGMEGSIEVRDALACRGL